MYNLNISSICSGILQNLLNKHSRPLSVLFKFTIRCCPLSCHLTSLTPVCLLLSRPAAKLKPLSMQKVNSWHSGWQSYFQWHTLLQTRVEDVETLNITSLWRHKGHTDIKLTPRLCPAWCRGGKGGKCYRWGAPWGSTAWTTWRNSLREKWGKSLDTFMLCSSHTLHSGRLYNLVVVGGFR